jgi:superfamily II DNA helicase RecQ
VQAKGRVGRDGNQSVALVLYNSYNARYVDSDVKNVIQTTKCRRQALLQSFLNASDLEQINAEMDRHTCCDLCAPRCKCESCELFALEKMMIDDIAHDDDDESNILSESDTTGSEYLSD